MTLGIEVALTEHNMRNNNNISKTRFSLPESLVAIAVFAFAIFYFGLFFSSLFINNGSLDKKVYAEKLLDEIIDRVSFDIKRMGLGTRPPSLGGQLPLGKAPVLFRSASQLSFIGDLNEDGHVDDKEIVGFRMKCGNTVTSICPCLPPISSVGTDQCETNGTIERGYGLPKEAHLRDNDVGDWPYWFHRVVDKAKYKYSISKFKFSYFFYAPMSHDKYETGANSGARIEELDKSEDSSKIEVIKLDLQLSWVESVSGDTFEVRSVDKTKYFRPEGLKPWNTSRCRCMSIE